MLAVSFSAIYNEVTRLLGKELAPALSYHCLNHTLDVTKQAEIIATAENVQDEEQLLMVRLAALLHDSGFTIAYQQHEQLSCRIALEILSAHDISSGMIDSVCEMIMATEVPQKPKDHLAAILCDADLDYLGRDDFYTLGENLKKEWFHYGIISSEKEWNERQIRFLEGHHYHTDYSKQLRMPVKRRYVEQLKKDIQRS